MIELQNYFSDSTIFAPRMLWPSDNIFSISRLASLLLANRSESAGPLWVITTNTTRVPNQKSPRQNARAVSVCVKWKSNLARRQRRCKHNFAFRRKRIIGFGVSSMQPVCFGWLLVHIRSWSAVPRWSTQSHRSIPQLVRTPSKPRCAWSKLSGCSRRTLAALRTTAAVKTHSAPFRLFLIQRTSAKRINELQSLKN